MARDRYIGFYWTLPVATHGFLHLPDDVDKAVKKSRTIRYQRALVERWVEDEDGDLIDEETFLEADPDHGTEHIVPVVNKLLARCRMEGAQLLVVAIWAVQDMGWRRHHWLIERLNAAEAEELPLCIVLEPDRNAPECQRLIDVFETWRQVRKGFTQGKPGRQHLVYQAIEDLKGKGGGKASSAVLARALNDAGILTPSDRPWTAANLRQFLRRYTAEQAQSEDHGATTSAEVEKRKGNKG